MLVKGATAVCDLMEVDEKFDDSYIDITEIYFSP